MADESKSLSAQLDDLKAGLEKYTTAEVDAKVKIIETKMSEVEKKADNKAEVVELQKEVNEFKDWKVKKDEADKENQKFIDTASVKLKQMEGAEITDNKVSFKSALQQAFEIPENKDLIEKLANNHKNREKRFTIELKEAGDMATTNVTGSLYGSVNRPGIIEPPKRKVHIRTLVPMGNIGPGNTFTFMRETGGEGEPAPVLETGTKVQFDMDLAESTVKVETIAGFIRVTKRAMQNIPGFLSYLNSRLPEKLLRVEDAQLLTGDGNTPNISGIMDSGNYVASDSTATILAEQLIDGIAQLDDTYERDATGILVRPIDYYSFFKNKASGSDEYDLPKNFMFVNGVLYINDVPVFASTGLPNGKYIVGDWQAGAQLLVQNAMRIEFFEQDADNVTKNKITVRIEEDIAFPIYGGDYFIVGDVAGSSPS